ncbi:hypothetical protein [Nostoc sp.]|uniref:hypothetical protein n=1 Tax=Nostoc sp. TaxID=1180 RepID=UPI002FFD3995
MEPVTLTAVATAIATIVLTKALEKTGEKLGEAALNKSRELIEQLRHKNKLPLLANATQQNPQQPLDYGKAVLELKAAADADTQIAQSVREVEAAANNAQQPSLTLPFPRQIQRSRTPFDPSFGTLAQAAG